MNKQVEAIKVIPRIEKGTDCCVSESETAVLFLPDMRDDHGFIGMYAHMGQHGMASLEYYLTETRPAKTAEERASINELLKEYKGLGGVECELKVLQRMPRRAAA